MRAVMSFYMPIVLTIFAAVALPAYIVHVDASKMFAERLSKRQHQLVRSLSYGLATRFDDAIMLTEVIGDTEAVRDFVANPIEREALRPRLSDFLRRASLRHADNSRLFVLDCKGGLLAAEKPLTALGVKDIPALPPSLLERAQRGQTQVGTVRLDGEITPVFLTPVMDKKQCLGLVALVWPFADMGQEWRELAESGRDGMRILLVDRDGQTVFVSDGDEHTLLKVGAQVSDTDLGRVFLSGGNGEHNFVDRYGQERVGAYFNLSGTGWTAIISSPRALVTGAAQSLADHSRNIALIFGGLAALLVSGLAWRMVYSQRQGARQLDMLMQGAGMGVWECHMPGTFAYSERWARVVGLNIQPVMRGPSEERIDGVQGVMHSVALHSMLERVHPEDREHLLRPVLGGEGHGNLSAELRFRQSDGSWRWMQIWGRVLTRDSDGAPLHITGVTMDIDLRKQAQQSEAAKRCQLEGLVAERTEDLRRARDQALAATEAKSYFLSTMSHEIRTPMNAIMGFLQLFSRDNLDSRQVDYLDKIRTAAGGLLRVINDILDISKIEAGKLEVERAPFSLPSVLDAVFSIMSFTARDKGLKLEMQVAEDVPARVMGDPTRLHQILLNLVGNALKFTQAGSVTVNVMRERKKAGQDGDRLRFAVTDTGVGITREQQQRLFQPYAQADVSVTRRFGGTGLGLAISRQLVGLMGGDIEVASEEGRGTTFTFRLPLEEAPAPAREESSVQSTDGQSLQHVRVLLVEDNIINQEVARTQLEHMGMQVCVADNGQEAVDKVREDIFDVLLMDMQMPVLDGLEATRQIRALAQEEGLGHLADVPILAMTANAMSEDRRRCMEAGMNGHIPKPFEVEELRSLLLRWAGRKPAAEEKTSAA